MRTDTETSGLEQNPETSPHICGQLVFDKRPSPFSEKGRPLQQMALGQLDIYTQKKEGDSHLTELTRNESEAYV